MPKNELGEQEHEVWQTVQRLGRCSIRQVFEIVGEPRGLAYTTIATVLDRLHAKGAVARERDGRSFVYRASRKGATFERARARSLVSRVLGSDEQTAVATLIDAVESIDPALLDRLADEIAIRRRRGRGS